MGGGQGPEGRSQRVIGVERGASAGIWARAKGRATGQWYERSLRLSEPGGLGWGGGWGWHRAGASARVGAKGGTGHGHEGIAAECPPYLDVATM